MSEKQPRQELNHEVSDQGSTNTSLDQKGRIWVFTPYSTGPASGIGRPTLPVQPKSPTEETVAAWVQERGGEFAVDKDNPANPLVLIDLTRRPISDSDLARLSGLINLQTLELGDTLVTDNGLVHLKALTNLRVLCLTGTQVTDAGLALLEELSNLEELQLIRTAVTDAGLLHLKALIKLQALGLSLTNVTDAGLAQLRELNGLQRLDLLGTRVTAQGVNSLQAALPELGIIGVSQKR